MMKFLKFGLVALVAGVLLASAPALAIGPPPITVYGLQIDTGTKTGTAVAGAVTFNKASGVITTEALSTAAAAVYTLTITDSTILATDQVFVSVAFGTNTTGSPQIQTVTPAAGSLVIVLRNAHLSAALNGTLKVAFVSLKQ